ncbi:hypothetical protein J7L13_00460 [bacterium]|nr:hypothetical protein [bacterium]
MNGKGKAIVGFVIFLVALSVFTGLNEAVQSVDITTAEPIFAHLIQALRYIFGNSVVAFAVAYCRNLLGFLENWFRARGKDEEIEYHLHMLGETFAKYEAGVLAISAWLPPGVAAAITFILDVVVTAIKKLREAL